MAWRDRWRYDRLVMGQTVEWTTAIQHRQVLKFNPIRTVRGSRRTIKTIRGSLRTIKIIRGSLKRIKEDQELR